MPVPVILISSIEGVFAWNGQFFIVWFFSDLNCSGNTSFPFLYVEWTVHFFKSSITQKSAIRPGLMAPLSYKRNRSAGESVAILYASSSSHPNSIAFLIQSSIWPDVTNISAWRSSVQKLQRDDEHPFTRGMSVCRFRSVEPSLIKRNIPFCSFSFPSFNTVVSWSLWSPVVIYWSSIGPVRKGACPSRMGVIVSLSITRGSFDKTPGTFIISPRPSTSFLPIKGRSRSAVSVIAHSSSGVAGTQDGSITMISNGWSACAWSIYSIPAVPLTFAISWGSAITVVVPCFITSRAYSYGVSNELSIWTWASIKPGQT